jgi:hypothetical protein
VHSGCGFGLQQVNIADVPRRTGLKRIERIGCSLDGSVSDCEFSTGVGAGKQRLYELYVVSMEIAW